MRLQGKSAMITGGASGIGRATALAFAREGAHVMILDIDEEQSIGVVEEIRQKGGCARSVKADITSEEDVRNAVEVAKTAFGRLDILDNNAGVSLIRSLTETTVEDYHRMMDLNVLGIMLTCKHAIALMMDGRGGSIINIASLSALRSRPQMPIYAASKGAVVAMTRSLAIDFGRSGIRANCICPAATRTPLLKRHYASIEDGETKLKENVAAIPLGRLAQAEDVVRLAVFLASEESQYISGQVIAVDGGSMAGTYHY
jgi:NAD(P)-dependent dehydrogenase (short-subunit alcohol dehydrogenase family)